MTKCNCVGSIKELDDFIPEEFRKSGDNWSDRKSKMKCFSCMWFLAKKIEEGQIIETIIGRCRRHSPTLSGWPVVYSADWCGDFKLDENKI